MESIIISKNLRELRELKGVSQAQVAHAAGITETGYQNYEVSRRTPTLEKLLALADYFNVSIDYLVGRTDNPEINR